MPKKPANPPAGATPSYEEAFARLESLVESLESGEVPLADMVAKFEEGHKLLKACQEHLRAAELRIEQLKTDGSEAAFVEFEEESES